MENEEKKYEDVIKALKGLQKVDAPANFEADLKRKINSEKYSKEEPKGLWQNIFKPSRLIPSLGLVVTAFVIFFVVESNSENMDNPFLMEPRVREDILVVTKYEDFEKKQEEVSKQKSSKKDEPALEKRRDESELKTSDDKMIRGGEKSGEANGFLNEKELARDQDINAKNNSVAESTITDSLAVSQPKAVSVTSSELVTEQVITKEELNFRQIQLTEEEQETVNALKNQVQSLEKTNKTQK